MCITILGLWDEDKRNEWELRGSRNEFCMACEELGSELVKIKQAIIVGNDSLSAADYYVVKGFVENAGEDTPDELIRVIKIDQLDLPFQEHWKSFPRLFTTHCYVRRREEAKLISVRDAEAVLSIGGTDITYHVGLASILARKTLVPIASFGGASRRLLDHLEAYRNPKDLKNYGSLNGPWTTKLMQKALRLTGITTQPRLLIIHGRGDDCSLLKDWLSQELTLESIAIMKDRIQVGHTLPEKFEQLAGDVDAAIALATPDDIGGINTTEGTDYKPRARQNVWLEVGWFWGRLGRNKIMVLRKGDVEVPSDLQGVELYSYEEKPYERSKEILSFIKGIKSNT